MGSDMLVANKDEKTMLHAELREGPWKDEQGGVRGSQPSGKSHEGRDTDASPGGRGCWEYSQGFSKSRVAGTRAEAGGEAGRWAELGSTCFEDHGGAFR